MTKTRPALRAERHCRHPSRARHTVPFDPPSAVSRRPEHRLHPVQLRDAPAREAAACCHQRLPCAPRKMDRQRAGLQNQSGESARSAAERFAAPTALGCRSSTQRRTWRARHPFPIARANARRGDRYPAQSDPQSRIETAPKPAGAVTDGRQVRPVQHDRVIVRFELTARRFDLQRIAAIPKTSPRRWQRRLGDADRRSGGDDCRQLEIVIRGRSVDSHRSGPRPRRHSDIAVHGAPRRQSSMTDPRTQNTQGSAP